MQPHSLMGQFSLGLCTTAAWYTASKAQIPSTCTAPSSKFSRCPSRKRRERSEPALLITIYIDESGSGVSSSCHGRRSPTRARASAVGAHKNVGPLRATSGFVVTVMLPIRLNVSSDPTRTPRHVRFSAACGDQADIQSAKCERLRFMSTRSSSLSAIRGPNCCDGSRLLQKPIISDFPIVIDVLVAGPNSRAPRRLNKGKTGSK